MQEEIKNWWKQAQADYQKAKVLYKNKHYDGTAFYSQQAVEKALKALFIIKFHRRAPRSHDLTMLCDEIKAPEKIRVIAENLTPTYLFSRYPEVAETIPAKFYSRQQAATFLKIAKEALAWIKKELNP